MKAVDRIRPGSVASSAFASSFTCRKAAVAAPYRNSEVGRRVASGFRALTTWSSLWASCASSWAAMACSRVEVVRWKVSSSGLAVDAIGVEVLLFSRVHVSSSWPQLHTCWCSPRCLHLAGGRLYDWPGPDRVGTCLTTCSSAGMSCHPCSASQVPRYLGYLQPISVFPQNINKFLACASPETAYYSVRDRKLNMAPNYCIFEASNAGFFVFFLFQVN